MMTTSPDPIARILLAWLFGCLLTLAMASAMLLGAFIVLGVAAEVSALLPLPDGAVAWYGGLFLLGAVVGAMVGGFRTLWVQEETDELPFVRLMGINALWSGVGLPLFLLLYRPGESPIGWMFMGFGTILGVTEWLVLGRPAIQLWRWIGVAGIAWTLWWGLVAAVSCID